VPGPHLRRKQGCIVRRRRRERSRLLIPIVPEGLALVRLPRLALLVARCTGGRKRGHGRGRLRIADRR